MAIQKKYVTVEDTGNKFGTPSRTAMWSRIGVWSFIAGIVLAVILAIVSQGRISPAMAFILGALGLVVGLLNVMDAEISTFLLASITFLVAAGALSAILGAIPGTAGFFTTFFDAVRIFIAPGAAVVALKALYNITRD